MQFLGNSKKDHNSNHSKLTMAYDQLQEKRNIFANFSKRYRDENHCPRSRSRASLSRTRRPRARFLEDQRPGVRTRWGGGTIEGGKSDGTPWQMETDCPSWLLARINLPSLNLISSMSAKRWTRANRSIIPFPKPILAELISVQVYREEPSYILDIGNIFYLTRWHIFRNLNAILYCDSIKYIQKKNNYIESVRISRGDIFLKIVLCVNNGDAEFIIRFDDELLIETRKMYKNFCEEKG